MTYLTDAAAWELIVLAVFAAIALWVAIDIGIAILCWLWRLFR